MVRGKGGWAPRPHQLALVEHAQEGKSVLLVAPTGGGKTFGRVPSQPHRIVRCPSAQPRPRRSHALCLAAESARRRRSPKSRSAPLSKWACPSASKPRTGDTSASRRQRQKHIPPDILLTTPEQLCLFCPPRMPHNSSANSVLSSSTSSTLCTIPNVAICCLSRLPASQRLPPIIAASDCRPPSKIQPRCSGSWSRSRRRREALCALIMGAGGAKPEIDILASDAYVPWAGHLAHHSMPEVMADAIKASPRWSS